MVQEVIKLSLSINHWKMMTISLEEIMKLVLKGMIDHVNRIAIIEFLKNDF